MKVAQSKETKRAEKLKELIAKAKKIHKNKYDYSLSDLTTVREKTTIICPIHGEFQQTWDAHVNAKSGCPKCNGGYRYNNDEWIEEVNRIHKNKYDYSKTHYTKAKENVTIICHQKDELGVEHGEFVVRAGNHMAGIGCPKCAGKYVPTTEEWIERAKKVHGDRYDYSKTKYCGSNKMVTITCPKHGDFEQTAYSHLSGNGCPMCNGGVSMTQKEFIDGAKRVHNGKYDYDNAKYVNAREKGAIKCHRHGIFYQTPEQHLRGQGCPKCKSSKLENIVIKLLDDNNIDYVYQYRLSNNLICDFLLEKERIIIECQGEQHYVPTFFGGDSNKNMVEKAFKLLQVSDLDKYKTAIDDGYDVVYFTIPKYFSNKEIDIKAGFYEDKCIITKKNNLLELIKGKDKLDIVETTFKLFCSDVKQHITRDVLVQNDTIRYKNYLIIFQPLVEMGRNRLNDRRRAFVKQGYKVVIIYEDEYLNTKDIVLNKLKHIFNLSVGKKIMARKCFVKTIDKDVAKKFLNENHVQGYVNSTLHLGAFNEDTLVGVMSFIQEGRNWNLSRFASDNVSICSGIGGKLFQYFLKNYEYDTIKSFADKRWTCDEKDNIYCKLGFKLVGSVPCDYYYIKEGECQRDHKFKFRKKILHRKYGLDMSLTETAMTEKLGYKRIWNCGLLKYELKVDKR